MLSILRSRRLSILFLVASVIVLPSSLCVAATTQFFDDFSGGTIDPFWELESLIPDSTVVQANGVLTITSPNAPTTFLDSRLRSVVPMTQSSFTANVDFRIPQGNAMAWLAFRQTFDATTPVDVFGAYMLDLTDYRTWISNSTETGNRFGRAGFGDERTAWHNLRLDYDFPTGLARSYVDEMLIGSEIMDLDNSIVFLQMKDRNTYGAGPSVIEFDNFSLTTTAIPEPSTAGALLLAMFVAATKRRRCRILSTKS